MNALKVYLPDWIIHASNWCIHSSGLFGDWARLSQPNILYSKVKIKKMIFKFNKGKQFHEDSKKYV